MMLIGSLHGIAWRIDHIILFEAIHDSDGYFSRLRVYAQAVYISGLLLARCLSSENAGFKTAKAAYILLHELSFASSAV